MTFMTPAPRKACLAVQLPYAWDFFDSELGHQLADLSEAKGLLGIGVLLRPIDRVRGEEKTQEDWSMYRMSARSRNNVDVRNHGFYGHVHAGGRQPIPIEDFKEHWMRQ